MTKIASVFLGLLFLCSFTNNEWQTIYNESGVQVSMMEADCKLETSSNQKWLLIKISNTTSSPKIVEWDLEPISDAGKCVGCGTTENHRLVKIAANETLEGKCSIKTPQELKFALRMLDVKTVSGIKDVKITNVKVSEL